MSTHSEYFPPLLQGHSRRILAAVKPVQNSGTLPIICESIQLVSIGCVCARSKLQKGLDRCVSTDGVLRVLGECTGCTESTLRVC